MIYTNDVDISSQETGSRSAPRNKHSSYLSPLAAFGIVSLFQRGKHTGAIGKQIWRYGYILNYRLNYGDFKKFLTTK